MTKIKNLLVGAAVVALPLSLSALPASAVGVENDITTEKSCTASGVTFEARAEWKYLYTTAGGVQKAAIDRLEWSIQDPGTEAPNGTDVNTTYEQGEDPQYGADDTTDYTIKVYSGSTKVQTLSGDDVEVNYANDGDKGELWKGRNPKNPEATVGSRITLSVGVDGDGQPNCKVTFRIPAELGPQLPA